MSFRPHQTLGSKKPSFQGIRDGAFCGGSDDTQCDTLVYLVLSQTDHGGTSMSAPTQPGPGGAGVSMMPPTQPSTGGGGGSVIAATQPATGADMARLAGREDLRKGSEESSLGSGGLFNRSVLHKPDCPDLRVRKWLTFHRSTVLPL